MTLFYVAAYGGQCGIVNADSLAEAQREAVLDVGRDNFQYVRPATRDDLAWFNAMGGREFSIYDLAEAQA